MVIRVKEYMLWVRDWNFTDGTRVKVDARTEARWRRIVRDYMRLQEHLARRVKPNVVLGVAASPAKTKSA